MKFNFDKWYKLEFVYKKPKLVPGKADREKQQQFLSELKELKRSLEENDKIFYMDGAHPQHNSKPAYGWMKKGKDTILKSNTCRQRININGALDPNTLEVSIQVGTAVNAQSTIQLFNQLTAVFGFFEKIDSYQSGLARLLTQKFHIIKS